jgi:hypothetical protein
MKPKPEPEPGKKQVQVRVTRKDRARKIVINRKKREGS